MRELPPPSELFTLKQLAERHPTLLPENRLRWAVRQRRKNGLESSGCVFMSPVGELIFHEPTTLAWLLGLSGRAKPRTTRRQGAGT
jgi:hypothetical protein